LQQYVMKTGSGYEYR